MVFVLQQGWLVACQRGVHAGGKVEASKVGNGPMPIVARAVLRPKTGSINCSATAALSIAVVIRWRRSPAVPVLAHFSREVP